MKALINTVLAASFGISIIVLAFVFVMWGADFAAWPEMARAALAFMSAAGALFGVAICGACGLYD